MDEYRRLLYLTAFDRIEEFKTLHYEKFGHEDYTNSRFYALEQSKEAPAATCIDQFKLLGVADAYLQMHIFVYYTVFIISKINNTTNETEVSNLCIALASFLAHFVGNGTSADSIATSIFSHYKAGTLSTFYVTINHGALHPNIEKMTIGYVREVISTISLRYAEEMAVAMGTTHSSITKTLESFEDDTNFLEAASSANANTRDFECIKALFLHVRTNGGKGGIALHADKRVKEHDNDKPSANIYEIIPKSDLAISEFKKVSKKATKKEPQTRFSYALCDTTTKFINGFMHFDSSRFTFGVIKYNPNVRTSRLTFVPLKWRKKTITGSYQELSERAQFLSEALSRDGDDSKAHPGRRIVREYTPSQANLPKRDNSSWFSNAPIKVIEREFGVENVSKKLEQVLEGYSKKNKLIRLLSYDSEGNVPAIFCRLTVDGVVKGYYPHIVSIQPNQPALFVDGKLNESVFRVSKRLAVFESHIASISNQIEPYVYRLQGCLVEPLHKKTTSVKPSTEENLPYYLATVYKQRSQISVATYMLDTQAAGTHYAGEKRVRNAIFERAGFDQTVYNDKGFKSEYATNGSKETFAMTDVDMTANWLSASLQAPLEYTVRFQEGDTSTYDVAKGHFAENIKRGARNDEDFTNTVHGMAVSLVEGHSLDFMKVMYKSARSYDSLSLDPGMMNLLNCSDFNDVNGQVESDNSAFELKRRTVDTVKDLVRSVSDDSSELDSEDNSEQTLENSD